MSDLSSSSTAAPRHPELATVDSSAVVLPSANDHTSILHTSTHDSDADDVPSSAAAAVLVRKQEQQLRHEALRALVAERYIVEWTPEEDDLIDPLERAVRCLVPIPKQYYWNVVVPEDWSAIPTRIKVWHRLIAGSVAVGEWTHSHVAQPVASALGLTSSRFHFVTDHMTVQEMEQSRRMVLERKLRNQEMQEGDAV